VSIPKIIHQIWIGYTRPTKGMMAWMERWKQLHPEWEYKLWDNDAFDKLQKEHGFVTDKSVFMTCGNMSEISDILRCELLYRFGGLYADTDQRCLKPFDNLLADVDKDIFICGKKDDTLSLEQTGVIASTPKHHMIERLLSNLPERSKTHKDCHPAEKYGPGYFHEYIDSEYWTNSVSDLVYPARREATSQRNFTDEELMTLHPEAYSIHVYESSWRGKTKKRKIDKFNKFAQSVGESNPSFMQEVIISVEKKRIDLEQNTTEPRFWAL